MRVVDQAEERLVLGRLGKQRSIRRATRESGRCLRLSPVRALHAGHAPAARERLRGSPGRDEQADAERRTEAAPPIRPPGRRAPACPQHARARHRAAPTCQRRPHQGARAPHCVTVARSVEKLADRERAPAVSAVQHRPDRTRRPCRQSGEIAGASAALRGHREPTCLHRRPRQESAPHPEARPGADRRSPAGRSGRQPVQARTCAVYRARPNIRKATVCRLLPPSHRSSRRVRGKLTLALLCAVAFLDFVDASIVNVALPSIRRALHFSVAGPAVGPQRLPADLRRVHAARRPRRRPARPPAES